MNGLGKVAVGQGRCSILGRSSGAMGEDMHQPHVYSIHMKLMSVDGRQGEVKVLEIGGDLRLSASDCDEPTHKQTQISNS